MNTVFIILQYICGKRSFFVRIGDVYPPFIGRVSGLGFVTRI
jgi:hypothetical protein